MKKHVIIYPNAVKVKLENRSITAGIGENGDIYIVSRIFRTDPEPPVGHAHFKGKVHEVTTRYTPEGGRALLGALAEIHGYGLCKKPEP